MSSGNLAVSVKNVVATDSYSEIAISYIINMNDISLANGSNVEMSMELTQIIKQKRPPSDQEGQEMEIFENITALYRSFSSGQIIDREAIGSFFSETSVATTMTIGRYYSYSNYGCFSICIIKKLRMFITTPKFFY